MTNTSASQSENPIEMTYEEVKPLLLGVVSRMSTEELGDFYGEVDEMIQGRIRKPKTRDDVVEEAKRLIEADTYEASQRIHNVEFIVNREKRTVVALLRGVYTDIVHARGKAKCDPNDCFNEFLGKAIALRRALKEPVPEMLLNAPQPIGREIGDKVYSDGEVAEVVPKGMWENMTHCYADSAFSMHGRVIDDSKRY